MSIGSSIGPVAGSQVTRVYIPNFENAYCVDVAKGIVESRYRQISWHRWIIGDEWRPLSPGVDHKGYLSVNLHVNGKVEIRKVHRLVLEAVVGPRSAGYEGSHLDGNQKNNAAYNLIWETSQENNRRKQLHGTDLRGEKHPLAKLTWEKVRQLRDDWASGKYTQEQLSQTYGISRSNVGLILNNARWNDPAYHKTPHWSVPDFRGEKNPTAKLTWEIVAQLRDDYKTGRYTQKQLGKKYGINQGTVCLIVNNQMWVV